MKISKIRNPKQFEPFKMEIYIETEQDLINLLARFNMSVSTLQEGLNQFEGLKASGSDDVTCFSSIRNMCSEAGIL